MIKELAYGKEISQEQIEGFYRQREENKNVSPPVFVANYLLQKGVEAQREIFNETRAPRRLIDEQVSQQVYNGLDKKGKNLYLVSYAAIVMGSLMPEIERAAVYGEFSMENFFNRYNLAVSRTSLPMWDGPESPVITIDEDQKQRMLKRIHSDKTLSSFLEEPGINDLPVELVQYLSEINTLSLLKELLKPYKTLVEKVIEKEPGMPQN